MVSTPPCHGGRGVRVPRSRLNVVKITLLKEDLQQIKTTKNQLVGAGFDSLPIPPKS